MPAVIIGERVIPYRIRQSTRARRKRIEVSPAGVEVVVPEHVNADDIERFVDSKRRWIHDRTEEVQEHIERLQRDTPQGFHSGAKILFRGRYLKLRVRVASRSRPSLTYRTGFHVELPRTVAQDERDTVVRRLVEEWMDERLLDDAWSVVRQRGSAHGLMPRDIRVKSQRTLWGSCGRDRIVRLDRKLARVPRPVFEYVTVHELCHLEHRDHSPAFWALVKRVLPDYQERKLWLEDHEVQLG